MASYKFYTEDEEMATEEEDYSNTYNYGEDEDDEEFQDDDEYETYEQYGNYEDEDEESEVDEQQEGEEIDDEMDEDEDDNVQDEEYYGSDYDKEDTDIEEDGSVEEAEYDETEEQDLEDEDYEEEDEQEESEFNSDDENYENDDTEEQDGDSHSYYEEPEIKDTGVSDRPDDYLGGSAPSIDYPLNKPSIGAPKQRKKFSALYKERPGEFMGGNKLEMYSSPPTKVKFRNSWVAGANQETTNNAVDDFEAWKKARMEENMKSQRPYKEKQLRKTGLNKDNENQADAKNINKENNKAQQTGIIGQKKKQPQGGQQKATAKSSKQNEKASNSNTNIVKKKMVKPPLKKKQPQNGGATTVNKPKKESSINTTRKVNGASVGKKPSGKPVPVASKNQASMAQSSTAETARKKQVRQQTSKRQAGQPKANQRQDNDDTKLPTKKTQANNKTLVSAMKKSNYNKKVAIEDPAPADKVMNNQTKMLANKRPDVTKTKSANNSLPEARSETTKATESETMLSKQVQNGNLKSKESETVLSKQVQKEEDASPFEEILHNLKSKRKYENKKKYYYEKREYINTNDYDYKLEMEKMHSDLDLERQQMKSKLAKLQRELNMMDIKKTKDLAKVEEETTNRVRNINKKMAEEATRKKKQERQMLKEHAYQKIDASEIVRQENKAMREKGYKLERKIAKAKETNEKLQEQHEFYVKQYLDEMNVVLTDQVDITEKENERLIEDVSNYHELVEGVKASIAKVHKRGHMESRINKFYMDAFKGIVDKLQSKSYDQNLVSDIVNLINSNGDAATVSSNNSSSISGDDFDNEGGEQLRMVSNQSVIKDYRGRVVVAGTPEMSPMSPRQRGGGNHPRSSRENRRSSTHRSSSRNNSYNSSSSRAGRKSPTPFGAHDGRKSPTPFGAHDGRKSPTPFGKPKFLEFSIPDDDSSCTATISSTDDFSF